VLVTFALLSPKFKNNLKRRITYFGSQFQRCQSVMAKEGVVKQSSSYHGRQEAEKWHSGMDQGKIIIPKDTPPQ
jgi:hypothetical protein